MYSSYLGGNLNDYAFDITIDNYNNTYIAGFSNSSNFPISNGFQDYFSGSEDVIITKFLEDNVIPNINNPDNQTFEEDTSGVNITWVANDRYPDNYTVYKNGNKETNGSWNNGVPIVISLESLTPDLYNFTIIIQDKATNYASKAVWVTVLHPKPIITTKPAQLNATEGEVFYYIFNASSNHPNPLNWSIITNASSWLSIDNDTGEITGTPAYLSNKWWNVTIIVADNNNLKVNYSVFLQVQQVTIMLDAVTGINVWLFDIITLEVRAKNSANNDSCNNIPIEWWINGVLVEINNTDSDGVSSWTIQIVDASSPIIATANISTRNVHTNINIFTNDLEFWFEGNRNISTTVLLLKGSFYTLSGRLVDGNGQAVAGMNIRYKINNSLEEINTTDSNGWINYSLLFDWEGTFIITVIKGNQSLVIDGQTVQLIVRVFSSSAIVTQVTPEGSTYETVINRPTTFTARVYFDEAAPVGLPGALILLIVNGSTVATGNTDVNGYITFDYAFIATGLYRVTFGYGGKSWGDIWVTVTAGYFAVWEGSTEINGTVGKEMTFIITINSNTSDVIIQDLIFKLLDDNGTPVIGAAIDWFINDVYHDTTMTGAVGITSFIYTFNSINIYTVVAKHEGQILATFTVTIKEAPSNPLQGALSLIFMILLAMVVLLAAAVAVPSSRRKLKRSVLWFRTRVERRTLFAPNYYARELATELEEKMGIELLQSVATEPNKRNIVLREVSAKLLRYPEITKLAVEERLKIVNQTTDRIITRYQKQPKEKN